MIYGIEYENSGWGNEEELERAAWDVKHDAPLTGDKAVLYADADEQPACLLAAYEHGETEEEMLTLLRAHIAECAHIAAAWRQQFRRIGFTSIRLRCAAKPDTFTRRAARRKPLTQSNPTGETTNEPTRRSPNHSRGDCRRSFDTVAKTES